jgi:hypothetical protein
VVYRQNASFLLLLAKELFRDNNRWEMKAPSPGLLQNQEGTEPFMSRLYAVPIINKDGLEQE